MLTDRASDVGAHITLRRSRAGGPLPAFAGLLLIVFMALQVLLIDRAHTRGESWVEYPFPSLSEIGGDFKIVYVAAFDVRGGLDPYLNHVAYGEPFSDNRVPPSASASLYAYSPLGAYLFVPLTLLGRFDAYRVFVLLSAALILMSIVVLLPYFKERTLVGGVLAIFGLMTYPFLFLIERGNWDAVPLAALAIALVLTERRRPILGGVALAVACLAKFYPLIFLLYLGLRRQWAVVIWTIAASAALVLVTGGPGLYFEGFHYLLQLGVADAYLWLGNHSIRSFFAMILPGQETVASYASYALVLALIGAMVAAVLHNRLPRPEHVGLELAAVSILMTIVPPTSNDYNLVTQVMTVAGILYFVAETGLARTADRITAGFLALCTAFVFLPTLYLPEIFPGIATTPTDHPIMRALFASKTTYLLLMWLAIGARYLLDLVRQPRSTQTDDPFLAPVVRSVTP